MAASGIKLRETQIIKVDNQGKTGTNWGIEFWEITFTSDKTFEIPTSLRSVFHVSAFGVHATTASALTWGAEVVKDSTTGAIAFNTSANSTEVWRVKLEGLI